jgi:hypothetical protein
MAEDFPLVGVSWRDYQGPLRSCIALHSGTHDSKGILVPVEQPYYGTMNAIPPGTRFSRTKIEEHGGRGWQFIVWRTVRRYSNGTFGSPSGEDVWSVAEAHDEKSKKHLDRLNGQPVGAGQKQ